VFQRGLLAEPDIHLLADSVLAILEKVGVLCQNDELLRALGAWGARVDPARERATFPRHCVEAFVAALREEAGPQDEQSFRPPPRPRLGTQVAQFFYDDRARERRPGTREDLITLIKLGEALHPEAGVDHTLLLREVPPLLEPLEAALVLAEYTRRPGPAFAWNVRQVDYLVEMGEVLGIPNWFTMGAVCFAHPLRFDRAVADRFVRMARAGLVMGLTGMQVSGATTPVTVAGFVAASGAEFVATWIAARALNLKVPLGGSIWAGSVDMHAGEVSYCAPDAMLRAFALREFLALWCGLRIPVGGGEYSDAKVPGLYAALEKAYKAMTIAAFTGYHPAVGEGMVDKGKTISPVQFLLDTEFTIALESLGTRVEVTPEAVGLESILGVGFGLEGSHLTTEHTLRHYRQSLWCPRLMSRSGWDGSETEEALWERARHRVEELVSAYRKPDTDPEKLAQMRRVVERARRDLA
jgi:trimethylamine--corrinoid protein Co-methyltransferase